MSDTAQVHREYDTPGPITLHVEVGAGSVSVLAADTARTVVDVTGRRAEEVRVEHTGDTVHVVAPRGRSGLFGRSDSLAVRVVLPARSRLDSRTGSADVHVEGALGGCELRSGSGDLRLETVEGAAEVVVGSGDLALGWAGTLTVKSGSGDIQVGEVTGAAAVTSGSGDVSIGRTVEELAVKTGSGDLHVGDASGGVALSTGSGSLTVGRIADGEVVLRSASGGARIGVPEGTPVWTDVTTVSGRLEIRIASAGQPAEGQPHVRVRGTSVSGDVVISPA